MEKVKLTQRQAKMIENHRDSFTTLMSKWHNKNSPTSIDTLTANEVLDAYFDGFEVEPEYKAGGWVVIIEKSGHTGHAYQITTIQENLANLDYGNGIASWWPFSDFRHATPEEIKAEKERRVWAKIGREVGKFKNGDVAKFKNGSLASVIDDGGIETAKQCYFDGELEGFYPAESFISFGGDE